MAKEYHIFNIVLIFLLMIGLIIPIFTHLEPIKKKSPITFIKPIKSNAPVQSKSIGLTRSILELYNFNYSKSLKYNRGGIILILLMILQLMLRFIVLKFNNELLFKVDLSQIVLSVILYGSFALKHQ